MMREDVAVLAYGGTSETGGRVALEVTLSANAVRALRRARARGIAASDTESDVEVLARIVQDAVLLRLL